MGRSTLGTVNTSFFTREVRHGEEWFLPTDACRGPWSVDACHAGPPTGLLARASERLVPEQRLARLTVDLTRPIPHEGFAVRAEVTRAGRTVSTVRCSIVSDDGREVVSATTMHVAAGTPIEVPTHLYPTPRLDDATPGRFPIPEATHELPMFDTGVEVRYPPGDGPEPGPTRMWMRALPLLPDEAGSGFQRICSLADCGNAVSRNDEPTRVAFMNTDLTILLHREPVGEWFGMDSVSRWEPTGHGMSDSLLFDESGPVGRSLQHLLLRPAD